MSRQIDWTAPLSERDRAWAEQFQGAHSQLLQANDAAHASAEVESEDVGDTPDYSKMKKPELVAEVERRNKEYNLSLSPEGTVEQLRKVLEEDDAAANANE